jgi:sulfonate transport system substrate-binding protein
VRWVQTLGSNKALEFLNAGSIDFGSTAGAAALVGRINGNPIKSIYVYSRPEWTALVTRKDTDITKVEDLKGKRVAVTRGTDPHIFLVRASRPPSSPRRTSSSCSCSIRTAAPRSSAATWRPGRASIP